MNIYGIPDEVRGNAPLEATEPVCPYCQGRHTEFVAFEFTNLDELTHELHFCYECETTFTLA